MRKLLVIALLVLGAGFAFGAGPKIPKAQEDAPEWHGDNDFMRRHHMDMLKHDRDLTMHLGDREIDASLKECVTCHAVPDKSGVPVTYEDERHFCRTCHDYTAVKVDCFTCHRSTPAGVDEGSAGHSTLRRDMSVPREQILAYLDEGGDDE